MVCPAMTNFASLKDKHHRPAAGLTPNGRFEAVMLQCNIVKGTAAAPLRLLKGSNAMTKFYGSLFGAALLCATPATAARIAVDGGPAAPSRVVTAADLDLYSAAGRTTLDSRIRTAARQVCRELAEGGRSFQLTCREAAIKGANRQRDRLLAQRGLLGDLRTAARAD